MSRNGSMPLRIALALLNDTRPGQILLDPYCGKGTSLHAGAIRGLQVYGIDVSPEAILCSRAKISNLRMSELLDYVASLDFDGEGQEMPAHVKVFYSPGTARQIMRLREQLLKDLQSVGKRRRLATGATAALLGILHGKSKISLSLPCAHSYAMSSSYVSKYAISKGLRRPFRNVKECLSEKIRLCFNEVPVAQGAVFEGSALAAQNILPDLRGQVDVVLTSPPYLNAQTYAKDNWLRLWLLGHDYRERLGEYIETGSTQRYERLMREWLIATSSLLKPEGKLIVVAGDVRLRGRKQANESPYKTGLVIRGLAEDTGLYAVRKYRRHNVPTYARNYNSLSNSNGHKRDLIERVFVAERT